MDSKIFQLAAPLQIVKQIETAKHLQLTGILVIIIIFFSLLNLSYLKADGVGKISAKGNSQKSSLIYLIEYKGKSPEGVCFITHSNLAIRLQKLVKERFTYMKTTWSIETPVEIKDNIFIAWGCKQHYCDATNFIIVVDFKKNVVYCGIRENNVVKTYSEDGSTNVEITKWANRQ